ncbi:IS3 family transposase [Kolteria novifilia]|uniref:IS3 family transposase n=1 Tax=Kolteria novifilia TaxID=2527975 RepID=UPI003AF34BC3
MARKGGKRHSPEQIVRKLRDAEAMQNAGKTIGEVCQVLGVSEQTFHRWRQQYGGMKADEARRLKELEQENAKLKRLLAEAELDKAMLKELFQGKLLSPSRRRAAVDRLEKSFGVSERRACEVAEQPRGTQRYQPRLSSDEGPLVSRMLELVRKHPRYGYRRIWFLLRREGFRVNRKRIYRLWRSQGLKVPKKQRKKRRLGSSANGVTRRRAEYKNHVWSWDFIHDRTSSGVPVKILSIVDEYTRECLSLRVGRHCRAEDVLDVLAGLFAERGSPGHIRSDNGPEFIAKAMRQWLHRMEVGTLYIAPGAPWENAYGESFHSRLRDEFLNVEEFASIGEAQGLTAQWKEDYNERRPHSSLGYQTPAEFARTCAASARATPSLQLHTSDQVPILS